MPHFQALADNAEPHPLVKQLVRDLEDYYSKFVALSFALSEVGNGHLLVLGGRDYENFVAALNNTRWDDQDSMARRQTAVDPALKAYNDAWAQLKASQEKVETAAEHVRETYRAKMLRCAIGIAEREHAKISTRAEEAKRGSA